MKGIGSKYGFAGCPSEFRVIVRDKEGGKGSLFVINVLFMIFILLSFLEIALEENDKRLRVNVLCSKSGDTVPEKVVCNLGEKRHFL